MHVNRTNGSSYRPGPFQSVRFAFFAFFSFFFIFAFSPSNRPPGAEVLEVVKIGVLAKRGVEQCMAQWGPTAQYLTGKIDGYLFEIVPLGYERIMAAAENGEVDFILANPAYYVGIEHGYGANRIATMKNGCAGNAQTVYGGVVFCRRDRKDIGTFEDLKGKSFMAAHANSFGGWIAVWRELLENGIDPHKDFSRLSFAGDHDKVVHAVAKGDVDAGCVRTEILEEMAAEGDVKLEDFFVLPGRNIDEPADFPYLHSTRLYPEWPMARLRGTSEELAEKVTVALLAMSSESTAAATGQCAGWTIPQNYQPVHECLRYLKLGPYRNLGKVTPAEVIKNYGYWIVFAGVAFFGFMVFTFVVLRMNDHLEESRIRLAAEVEERRKTDDALKEAKQVAEEAARAKSEFLANMSHEIRTPMNGVIAAAELAMNETLSPKVEHFLKIILSSAHSLLGLINDILDLSKIEAGKLNIESRGFMLDEIIDRVVDLFFNSAAAKRIELLVDLSPDVPRSLVGDPLRLQQIFTNLVGNAVKFTDKGGHILIGARCAETMEDRVKLALRVKDTGVGISPEYRRLLFQPFSQADASDTRRYEGTGLGLSICKRLVEMMDGEIGVESEPGEGSEFHFTAWFKLQEKEPTRELKPPTELQFLHVLVVDDCEESREIVSSYLTSFGFTVETAPSGVEGLCLLEERQQKNAPFNLVIVDWLMPEMDGLEVSEKINEKGEAAPPIIMMTAFGSDVEKAKAEKIGVRGFLIKPIYQSTLFDAIMDAFGKESHKRRRVSGRITTDAMVFKRLLRGFRILVVEDNPTNRDIAVAILQSAGIRAETAVNGKEAVDRVAKEQFDAVLMDIQMPEMNGFQATRKIREDPAMANLPIVAMTAHAMRGDEEKCMSAGMDGYVAKPVDQARLFRLLWRLLKNRRPALDPEPLPGETEPDAPEKPRQSPALPARVAGIEIGLALENMGLDPAVYRKILSGFCKNNRDMLDSFHRAYESEDVERIAELAHSLKGSAGNIGAEELQKAAAKLEAGAKEQNEELATRTLLDRVESALKVVLNSIEEIEAGCGQPDGPPCPACESGPEMGPETAAPAGEAMEGLQNALQIADPVEIGVRLPQLKGILAPDCYRRLQNLIEKYDYDEARDFLSGMEQDANQKEGEER